MATREELRRYLEDVEAQGTKVISGVRTKLKDMKVDIEDSRTSSVRSQLISAVKKKDITSLKIMLDNNKEGFLAPCKDDGYNNPFHIAAKFDSLDFLKLMISEIPQEYISANIDSHNNDGITALQIAIKRQNWELMKALLDARANPNSQDSVGNTSLHLLAEISSSGTSKTEDLMKALSTLMDRDDFCIDPVNSYGNTPLQIVIQGSTNEDFLRKLIKHGARVTTDMIEPLTPANVNSLSTERETEAKVEVERIMDCIINNSEEPIIEQLTNNFANESGMIENIKPLLNGFIGSKRVLYHLIEVGGNDNIIKFVVDKLGADLFMKNKNGEIPLHISLKKSNVTISKLLLERMKQLRRDTSDDLDLNPYKRDLLIKNALDNTETNEQDCSDCLNLLFEPGIKIDVTEKDLETAADYKNQEAMKTIFKKGAYEGESNEDGNVMNNLVSTTLTSMFDDCISPDDSENVLSREHTLQIDYQYIYPKHRNEMSLILLLDNVSKCYHLEQTLLHPAVQVYLYALWHKMRWFHYGNILLYILITCFLIVTGVFKWLVMYNVKVIQDEQSNNSSTILDDFEYQLEWTSVVDIFFILITLLLTFFIAIKEIIEIIGDCKEYGAHKENWLECIVIISTFIWCIFPLPNGLILHWSAWTVIASSYVCFLKLGRLQPFTLFISFTKKVMHNYATLMFPMTFLFLAFSFSFYMIFNTLLYNDLNDPTEFPEFTYFLRSFVRTIVMTTGEYEYASYSEAQDKSSFIHNVSALILFLVFLFLQAVVLMNVLTGLAVGDLKDVKDDIILETIKFRLREIITVHKFFDKYKDKWSSLGKYAKNHQVLDENNSILMVKINKKAKSAKIKIKDNFDRRTVLPDQDTINSIRDHYLKQVDSIDQNEEKKLASEKLQNEEILKRLASTEEKLEKLYKRLCGD